MSDRPARRAFPSIDPDPLTVEEQPVRRPKPDRSGMTIVWLAIALPLAVLILVAVIALAASSAGQTTDPVDVSGTSSAVQRGAPHERERRPAMGGSVALDRHDGGAPLRDSRG